MIYSIRQKQIANKINNQQYPNDRIITGENFIHHFITSNSKSDTVRNEIVQKYRIFPSKPEALEMASEFLEVLNDLELNKIIKVHKYPNQKHNIKFILKESQNRELEFTEFHELFDEYITAGIEIIDQYKFDRFIKQKYLHDKEYNEQQQKKSEKRKETKRFILNIALAIFGIGVSAIGVWLALK